MKLLPSLLALASLGVFAQAAETSAVLNVPDFPPRTAGAGEHKIFNGKDLTGWSGNPDLWTVENGAITGKTTAEKPLKHNTFLVWTDGEVSDFELTFKYKIVPGDAKGFGNSGVQYRSKVLQPGENGPIIAGYQADFECGTTYSGILYEERMRGILAKRGEKTVIKADPADPKKSKVEVVGTVGNSDEIQKAINKDDWNDYKIIAKGNHLQHFINGKQTIDVTDETEAGAKTGVLALQIHAGSPMMVQFADMVLKTEK